MSMTEQELKDIEQARNAWHDNGVAHGFVNVAGSLGASIDGLLAEVRRLRADREAMLAVFGDACQEPGALGDALALAKREGRRESLGHWLHTPPDQWPEWMHGLDAAPDPAAPGSVGDLLARYSRAAVAGPDEIAFVLPLDRTGGQS